MEPGWRAARSGPGWTGVGETRPAVDVFDEINLMLFSNGVDAVGLAPIERWRAISERARRGGMLIGVDGDAYPRDFATYTRYESDLKRNIRARYPVPGPLMLDELEEFAGRAGERYAVHWVEP